MTYCKSTNFGVLLYLANLANSSCVFSIIFVPPTYVSDVDRTLHRRGDAKFNSHQITLFLRNAKFYRRQNLLIYSMYNQNCAGIQSDPFQCVVSMLIITHSMMCSYSK